MLLAGFVLWQQGKQLCRQPATSSKHSLLMNGDIFTQREISEQSDTEWLLEQIDLCGSEDDLIRLFRRLDGPYSLIFFNKTEEILYFIRDSLGRQSLLLATDENDSIYFSSVLGINSNLLPGNQFSFIHSYFFAAKSQNFESAMEIPPLGLYAIDLKTKLVTLSPWKEIDKSSFSDQLDELQSMLKSSIQVHASILPRWMHAEPSLSTTNFNFEQLLHTETKTEPEKIFQKMVMESSIETYCNALIAALKKSVYDRISATPDICRTCLIGVDGNRQCAHAKIGILFSGGIDCTILACLADQLIAAHLPIDLINVSFEKMVHTKTSQAIEIDYNTPDRLSALASLGELQRLNSQRQWNLIKVNVTRNELNEMLRSKISHLVYPLRSVLDESLGAVLWFGSNANGFLNEKPYKSSCRVSSI